jgi:hypothetical protein
MRTKHEVLQAHLNKWLACKGDRKERGRLTKELSELLSIHEKSVGRAMRRLQKSSKTKKESRGRPIYYGKDVDSAIFEIWEVMDKPCAENMHSAIEEHVRYFVKDKKWRYGDETTGKLCAISIGTLKNRIAYLREKYDTKRGKTTTVSSPLKGMIAIRKSHTWVNLPPGYVQTDSVVHCGDLLSGDVVYSVGCVDFATYWSEYNVQWNKGQIATCESLKLVRGRFPFTLSEIHPDTGNEFINYHVYQWAQKEGLNMTRSEPYKKNDNMCIEERNNSIARKHLGYARIDDESLVPLAKEILCLSCTLHNHFRPVRRMVSKERIGAKWKRKFEKVSKTPCQRVLENSEVGDEDKADLRELHNTLNPLELKVELDRLKDELSRALLKKKKISHD